MWAIYTTSLKSKLPLLLNMDKNTIIRNTESRNQMRKHTLSHLISDKANTADCEEEWYFQ